MSTSGYPQHERIPVVAAKRPRVGDALMYDVHVRVTNQTREASN